MKTLTIGLLILLSMPLLAETLTWEPPTTRQDGTPLDTLIELDKYVLTCGDKATAIEPTVAQGETRTVNKAEILPGYGSFDCSMVAVDTDGLTSEPSNSVAIDWVKQPPAAPTSLLLIQ